MQGQFTVTNFRDQCQGSDSCKLALRLFPNWLYSKGSKHSVCIPKHMQCQGYR